MCVFRRRSWMGRRWRCLLAPCTETSGVPSAWICWRTPWRPKSVCTASAPTALSPRWDQGEPFLSTYFNMKQTWAQSNTTAPPPQEQRVSHLQAEAGLQTLAAPGLKLRRSDLQDLPEPGRVWGTPAERPGAPQPASQQGGAELQHRGGAPAAGPLQVREVGATGGHHRSWCIRVTRDPLKKSEKTLSII